MYQHCSILLVFFVTHSLANVQQITLPFPSSEGSEKYNTFQDTCKKFRLGKLSSPPAPSTIFSRVPPEWTSSAAGEAISVAAKKYEAKFLTLSPAESVGFWVELCPYIPVQESSTSSQIVPSTSTRTTPATSSTPQPTAATPPPAILTGVDISARFTQISKACDLVLNATSLTVLSSLPGPDTLFVNPSPTTSETHTKAHEFYERDTRLVPALMAAILSVQRRKEGGITVQDGDRKELLKHLWGRLSQPWTNEDRNVFWKKFCSVKYRPSSQGNTSSGSSAIGSGLSNSGTLSTPVSTTESPASFSNNNVPALRPTAVPRDYNATTELNSAHVLVPTMTIVLFIFSTIFVL